MKASFKKLTLLIFHRHRKQVTEVLQEIGVLHIKTDSNYRSVDLETLESQKNSLLKAVEIIEGHKRKKQTPAAKTEATVNHVVKNVLSLKHRMDANVLQKESLLKDRLQRIPWGDFDLHKMQRLAAHGLEVQLCVAPKKEFENYDFGALTYQLVHRTSNQVYFAVIGKETISVPFESVKVPERTLSELALSEQKIQEENEEMQREIATYARYLPQLKKQLLKIDNELAFALAQGSYQEHKNGAILSLSGWFPESTEQHLLQYLKEEQFTYHIEKPKPESDVPVMLQNRRYSRLFEPITKIFELPNYYELDPTPLIAVFYPIMFAYCLGDAGYGLLFFTAALVGWFSFLKKTRNMALLGMVLGVLTAIMGLIKSGSVFGIPTTSPQWEVFGMLGNYVVIPDDRDFIFNAFNVALMIGVVQIFLGIFISIYNKLRYEHWTKAISQFGKLMIVTGLIWMFLADMQEMAALQHFGILRNLLLIGGVLLVLFFHDMAQALPTRAATGLLPLFFIFTGVLGDVLSYVRLFALGVASAVLGLVVNQIGLQIMGNSWWGIVIGVIFLLFGHSLNFCIAVLGSFVHPLRLTFVEFYNNAQFKGGGKEYRPFQKQSVEL